MSSAIRPSLYKDRPAITLELETVEVQFLPDHGEAWSIPWVCTIQDQGKVSPLNLTFELLHFAVHGVRFPYRLEK